MKAHPIYEQFLTLESAVFEGFSDSEREQLRQLLSRTLANVTRNR